MWLDQSGFEHSTAEVAELLKKQTNVAFPVKWLEDQYKPGAMLRYGCLGYFIRVS